MAKACLIRLSVPVVFLVLSALSFQAVSQPPPPPAPNPDLVFGECNELTITLLIDESGSIDDGPDGDEHEQMVRDAVLAIAASLEGTVSKMAVVEFSTYLQRSLGAECMALEQLRLLLRLVLGRNARSEL